MHEAPPVWQLGVDSRSCVEVRMISGQIFPVGDWVGAQFSDWPILNCVLPLDRSFL